MRRTNATRRLESYAFQKQASATSRQMAWPPIGRAHEFNVQAHELNGRLRRQAREEGLRTARLATNEPTPSPRQGPPQPFSSFRAPRSVFCARLFQRQLASVPPDPKCINLTPGASVSTSWSSLLTFDLVQPASPATTMAINWAHFTCWAAWPHCGHASLAAKRQKTAQRVTATFCRRAILSPVQPQVSGRFDFTGALCCQGRVLISVSRARRSSCAHSCRWSQAS